MMAHVVGEADAELEGEEQQQPQQWRPTRAPKATQEFLSPPEFALPWALPPTLELRTRVAFWRAASVTEQWRLSLLRLLLLQSCCSSELGLKTAETARLAAAVLGQLGAVIQPGQNMH